MTEESGEISVLLRRWQTGDHAAQSALFCLLMPELRQIAGTCFRRRPAGHSIQPTVLVNEAFIRLATAKNIDLQDRGYFLAIAARIMRRCLIDHARGKPSVKFLPMEDLPECVLGKYTPLDFAIAIDALLDELDKESHRQYAVVELKYCLGLTDAEAAEVLHLELPTVQREWHRARVWLFERLSR